jgi:serine/threonine-protein kinase
MDERYEILEQIAAGDFATVYRGRDRELGREVAIKQIHQQFLADDERLNRFWQEAQLLATLEHPHIMTIYDLVRRRGWVVLELMRGSLRDNTQGQPLNLDYLRVTLFHSLQALRYLHSKGIIHGDVKPSNLMIDKRGRVKLGDFGLARRANNDEGSLLKGTTRYMAPEVVSDQFGRVGPASDLYSLGFSAYELMCGSEQFETLFPGLNAFGRDKQVAWMMWHAAADRRLPEISRVMAGVPEDLAHVIQRLVAKNPAQRYATADQALADLARNPATLSTTPAPEEAPPGMPPEQRRKRIMAAAAFGFSCLMSLAMLIPWGGSAPPSDAAEIEPGQAIVRGVLPGERKLIVEIDDKPQELSVGSRDKVFLNDRASLLRQLREGDRLTIRKYRDETGRAFLELAAARPETARGKIDSLQADEGRLTVAIDEGEDRGTKLPLEVAGDVTISLNGDRLWQDKQVRLADLRVGDRVEATHVGNPEGRMAVALNARRLVPLEGVLRAVNSAKRELTIADAAGEGGSLETLPWAEKCQVTLNGRQFLEGELLKLTDLKPGDRVTVQHDTHVARVDAWREFHEQGEVHAIKFDPQLMQVFLRGESQSRDYRVSGDTKITLGGESVAFADLRRGDEVTVTHDMAEGDTPTASAIEATRPPDLRKWALLIAAGKHDDATVGDLPHALDDAHLLRDKLIARHRVPPQQLLLLADESRIRLEQGIPSFLQKVPADGQLTVYVASRTLLGEDEVAYLATRDVAGSRIEATGLPLRWLIEQLEGTTAREKLLLLDSGYPPVADGAPQPAAAELIERLAKADPPLPLKTTNVIAGSRAGESARQSADGEHGRFAWTLADAFAGGGDKNRDNRLEITELYEYVEAQMALLANDASTQRPALFLANSTPPPRLSPEARQAVQTLLANVSRSRIDAKQLATQFEEAKSLAGNEPEPRLAYALALYKHRQFEEALAPLEDLKASHPHLLLPHQLATWIQLNRRAYLTVMTNLQQMAVQIQPPKKPSEAFTEPMLRRMDWMGRLREFTMQVGGAGDDARVEQQAQKLDARIAELGSVPKDRYEEGRADVRVKLEQFNRQIAAAESQSQPKLRLESRQPTSYAGFDVDDAVQQVLERLND